MQTFEDYLKKEIIEGHIYHEICAKINGNGNVQFYIHANGQDSDTIDFGVNENQLINLIDDDNVIHEYIKIN